MPGPGNEANPRRFALARRPPGPNDAAMFRPRPRLAWLIAIAADCLQVAIFPVFGPGFASPANNVLDVAVALLMTSLVGWNWAFLPTFVVELVPFVDLVPTWTLACFIATRRFGKRAPPPGPPPLEPPNRPRV